MLLKKTDNCDKFDKTYYIFLIYLEIFAVFYRIVQIIDTCHKLTNVVNTAIPVTWFGGEILAHSTNSIAVS